MGMVLTVKATGYADYTASSIPSTVGLKKQTPASTAFTLFINPLRTDEAVAASSGAQVSFRDASGQELEALTVNDDGAAKTAKPYPPGTYQIDAHKEGFNELKTSLTANAGDSTFTFSLISGKDGGAAALAASLSPNAAITSPATAAVSSAAAIDDYEYIYPNSVDGKYFQAAQARMYIGNLFIDELNLCQFQLMDNKIPVYGYRSRFFDAMAQGHSLVQGQLAVNFVSEGYMYTVLKEFQNKISAKASLPSGVTEETAQQIQNLMQSRSTTTDATMLAAIDTQLKSLATTPATQAYIKSQLSKPRQLSAYRTFNYRNACYLDIPFDIVVKLEGAGRTATRKLERCFLSANDFGVAHDGKTLLDTYGFVARRLA
jgi:hypothetical protein